MDPIRSDLIRGGYNHSHIHSHIHIHTRTHPLYSTLFYSTIRLTRMWRQKSLRQQRTAKKSRSESTSLTITINNHNHSQQSRLSFLMTRLKELKSNESNDYENQETNERTQQRAVSRSLKDRFIVIVMIPCGHPLFSSVSALIWYHSAWLSGPYLGVPWLILKQVPFRSILFYWLG